jgi:hypothetical protein
VVGSGDVVTAFEGIADDLPRPTLIRLSCSGSQLPGYLRVGDQTLGHLHLVRLDLVESEQMLGSFW